MAVKSVQQEFADGVLARFNRSTEAVVKSARAEKSLPLAASGHPAFVDLPLGGSGHCDLCCAFIDLTAFTARTFWEEPSATVWLAVSVLSELCLIVERLGGHVLGLRGDGVFAGFGGPGAQAEASIALALGACALALDAAGTELNDGLKAFGLAPVQVRAGVDYGRVDFVRIGTPEVSEVNVIGFAANFASKCEKIADSWEVVVGDGAASVIPAGPLTEHPNSPKRYTHEGATRSYGFHQLAWRTLVSDAEQAVREIAGRPAASVLVG